jgi:large subunit ribosomal protein L25
MPETITLAAEPRDRAGKGTARATRRAGRVPAVVYGGGQTPVLISLDAKSLQQHCQNAGFFSHILELSLDGGSHRVLPRDVQSDPVNGRPMHVDFMRVDTSTELVVDVPVEFINREQSPGLRRGGVLNVVRHEIEVRCRADQIPDHITVDLAGFDLGASVHVSSVKLPEGVKPTIERDFTIATIAAPSALRGAEAVGEPGPGEAAADNG